MALINNICVKHGRMNCPDKKCNPSGTIADQIIEQVEREVKDLKSVKQSQDDDTKSSTQILA